MSCRSANAAYQSEYRRLKAQGKILLGSLVSAVGARRRINELKADGIQKQDIARLLGLKRPILELHTGPDAKMTMRNLLRLKRLHRRWMSPDAEAPDQADAISLRLHPPRS